MEFQTRYKTRKVRFFSSQPSLTDVSDFESTLIPNIFAGHGVPLNSSPVQFGDFTRVPTDLADAHKMLSDASEQFLALPSSLRERFGNKPLALLDFLRNPSNRAEAESLGLLKKSVSPSSTDEPADHKAGSTDTPT